jgi:hypothetical protein
MIDEAFQLQPATARKVFLWQTGFLAVLIAIGTTANALSAITDAHRSGTPVVAWHYYVWEYSSGIALLAIMPLLHKLLERYPPLGEHWWRRLPLLAVATVPFSVLHVVLMVTMRKAVYVLMGAHYDFGPWLQNLAYEYNKDVFAFVIVTGCLVAFRFYGLWLDGREARAAHTEADSRECLQRLVVRKLNREFILNVADIEHIDAAGNYVTLHKDGKSYSLRESLASLEKKLDQEHFVRVHRSHIVNLNHIREIQPWDNGDYRILMQDGSVLNFSRRYRSRLDHLFS